MLSFSYIQGRCTSFLFCCDICLVLHRNPLAWLYICLFFRLFDCFVSLIGFTALFYFFLFFLIGHPCIPLSIFFASFFLDIHHLRLWPLMACLHESLNTALLCTGGWWLELCRRDCGKSDTNRQTRLDYYLQNLYQRTLWDGVPARSSE